MNCKLKALELLSQNKLKDACFLVEHLNTEIAKFVRFIAGRSGVANTPI